MLRMLGTELDGPEIARELVVSLNTVRTHTKNIYAKLGVHEPTSSRKPRPRAPAAAPPALSSPNPPVSPSTFTTCGEDGSPTPFLHCGP